jgi:Ca-activated chloride channel family protein
MLQQKGIVLKPFVIGMALTDAAAKNFSCIGQTINTGSDAEFNQTLKNMVDESIAKTTLQVNLLDSKSKATETAVAMTFYDSQTKIAKEYLIHTMNSRGNPDTITISPFFNYDIQIHTIPELWVKGVALKRNVHNEVAVDAAQGHLTLKLQSVLSKSAVVDRIKCIIHQHDSSTTVHVQKLNSDVKLLTGKYDLEILTLPRIFIKSVQIDDSKTTHIEIPTPGILTMNKSYEYYGVIFVEEKGALTKIYDLKPEQKQETIALQPGKYRLVYRAKFAKSGHNTIDKEFEILSGGSIGLRL